MKYVIGYQRNDSDRLDSYPIPEGAENAFDGYLTKGRPMIKFKNGLVLLKDEIKGIFTDEEFDRFKRILWRDHESKGNQ